MSHQCSSKTPTRSLLKPLAVFSIITATSTITSCKLPDSKVLQAIKSSNTVLVNKERLAAAGTSFAGDPAWAGDFNRKTTKGWAEVPASNLSENQAVAFAVKNGLSTNSGEIGVSRAEAQQRLARSSFYPKLIVQLDAGRDVERAPLNIDRGSTDYAAGVFLRQDVFTWGANQDRFKSAKLRTVGQRHQVDVLQNSTAATVRAGFSSLRRAQAEVNAFSQGIKNLESLVKGARERAEAGVDSQRPVAELESRLAEYRSRKVSTEAETARISSELTSLLGSRNPIAFNPGARTPLKAPAVSRDILVSRALNGRPDLRAKKALASAARAEVDAAKKARLPSISLSAGVTGETDFDDIDRGPDFRAAATSRWVPVAGGEHRARVQIAEADLRQAELDHSHARRVTISGINGALDEYRSAKQAVAESYKALTISRKAQDLTTQVFAQDGSKVDPLIESHESLVRSLVRHAQNQALEEMALIKIHHLLGHGRTVGSSKGVAKS